MKRREFIAALGSAAAAWPVAARAQQPGRTYRFGVLFQSIRSTPYSVAFYDELQRLGFVAGHNLVIDDRGYGLKGEQLAGHALELVKAQVDLIFAGGDAAIRAAQQATTTVPILAAADDMLKSGFVTSLSKPEGNMTGLSLLATELDGKRQEILAEALPGAQRMAALADATGTSSQQLKALQDAARTRGVELVIYRAAKAGEIAGAIDKAKSSDAAALNVLASPFLNANRGIILERTAAARLPAIYQWPETAEEGGLIAYGPRIVQLFRDVLARQCVRLLQGAKPADTPVEQPTKFELVVNLKTAKAIAVNVPNSLLLRADEVIE
jgi:putative ABC transport system substrate-binding protein